MTTPDDASIQAPATRQQSPAQTALNNLLTMCEERFTPVLGKVTQIDWPAFALGVRAACMRKPELFEIIQRNPAHLVQGLAKAAALNLSPHPDLEHFDLIPYKGEVDAQVRCKGYLHLAMQSGLIDEAKAFVIYRDEVEQLKAARMPLVDIASGEPTISPDNRMLDDVKRSDADIVGAIAVVRVKGRSRPVVRSMTRDELLKRKAAGNGKQPAWSAWFPEMCQKTVLKSVLKSGMVPLGRVAEVLSRDDDEPMKQAVVVSPEVAKITATAERKDEFDRRMDDPLPSIETICAELIEDIAVAADTAGLANEGLDAIVAEVADVAMVDMDPEQLRAVLAKVRGEA